MKGLVGGTLLVGGLLPGPPGPPLKSGPALCRHLSPTSTAQEIVNWVTTANGCVHSAYTTQLDFAVGKFVQTRQDCRSPLVANCVLHTADATQLDS